MMSSPIMQKAVVFSFCLLFSSFITNAQEDAAQKIEKVLTDWAAKQATEKVYVHTDKPYYVAGDTIWMKAYVTTGARNLLSGISGALYVDLINQEGNLFRSLRLPVMSGTAKGSLILPYEMAAGTYRLRAYTQWMRNAGPTYFYDHFFAIGNALAQEGNVRNTESITKDEVVKKKTKKDITEEGDVELMFFPEGGHLVQGLYSKIAVKATGKGGIGLMVKGEVMDGTGQSIASWESEHAGMGLFWLAPQAGEKYMAKVTFPDGSEKSYPLPAVEKSGYVLEVNANSLLDTFRIRIQSSPDRFGKTYLLAHNDGEVLCLTSIDISKPITQLVVPATHFPAGIAHFTLFSSEAEPLNERLVFARIGDTLQLRLSGLQDQHEVKEHVQLKGTVRKSDGKSTIGSFSVAVIDEHIVPTKAINEQNILAALWLNGAVNGRIEDAGYYFERATEEKLAHLDLLLMTQGYRRFVWKTLLAGPLSEPSFPKEPLTTSISGQLVTLTGKPVPNGKVTLFSTDVEANLDTIADANGYFVFDRLLFADDVKFTIQGRNPKGGKKVEVLIDSVSREPVDPLVPIIKDSAVMEQSLVHSEKLRSSLIEHGIITGAKVLDEVEVNARKGQGNSSNLNASGRADQVITAEELGNCPMISTCLPGRLTGVLFRPQSIKVMEGLYREIQYPFSTRGNEPMLIVVDGRPLNVESDGDIIFDLFTSDAPSDFESIEVLRDPSLTGVYGMGGRGGVLVFNHKSYSERAGNEQFNMRRMTARGFSKVREFYSPSYEGNNVPAIDLRSTIYWNPTLITDSEGLIHFDYFNAASPGVYRVLVEGISESGEMGRAVLRYRVE